MVCVNITAVNGIRFSPAGLRVNSSMTRGILIFAIISALTYVGLCIGLLLSQRSLIYYPQAVQWWRAPLRAAARPRESKVDVNGLAILRRGGADYWLPVRGSQSDKFYDAFDVIRFRGRLRDDLLTR
jgi:hypothetical protein